MNCLLEMNAQSIPFQMKRRYGSHKKSNGQRLCGGHGLNFMMLNLTSYYTSFSVLNKDKICVYCVTTTRNGASIYNRGHGFLLRMVSIFISMKRCIRFIVRIVELKGIQTFHYQKTYRNRLISLISSIKYGGLKTFASVSTTHILICR